ncbi:MAG: DUF1799 domain-containing protein [Porticoccaceae bacterium]|nr:DUF1799 domain-containing protein [Porticoccaceae bacterium]
MVFPDNRDAARVFYASGTQWRYAWDGSRLALDYRGVTAVLEMLGLPVANPQLFEDLRLIEKGALGATVDIPELKQLHILRIDTE